MSPLSLLFFKHRLAFDMSDALVKNNLATSVALSPPSPQQEHIDMYLTHSVRASGVVCAGVIPFPILLFTTKSGLVPGFRWRRCSSGEGPEELILEMGNDLGMSVFVCPACT